jgi:hypothetical protein
MENENNDWTTMRKTGEQLAGSAKGARELAQAKTWRSWVAALCFLVAPLSSQAQSLSIDWFTINGGGGTSTGSGFAVSGTIAQPEANAKTLSGGNLSLVGGFWSLFAVQTPGAPLLTVRLTATGTAIVSWPSPSTGFLLQENTDIGGANWVTAPQSVSDDGANRFILVNPSGNRFYRLFKPF